MMPPKPGTTDIVPEPGGTLTYEQASQLMMDSTFRGRVKVACLSYAQYISIEGPDAPAHNTRFQWAQKCFMQPDAIAGQIAQPTVMNPNVQQAGSAVTDPNLQAAVQTVIDATI